MKIDFSQRIARNDSLGGVPVSSCRLTWCLLWFEMPPSCSQDQADRWSTEVYKSEDSCSDIPLFTLSLVGEERSTISRLFPGLFYFFGIIASGLMWIAGCWKYRRSLIILTKDTSLCEYLLAIEGVSGFLLLVANSRKLWRLKLIWKTAWTPSSMKLLKRMSGCSARRSLHWKRFRGK